MRTVKRKDSRVSVLHYAYNRKFHFVMSGCLALWPSDRFCYMFLCEFLRVAPYCISTIQGRLKAEPEEMNGMKRRGRAFALRVIARHKSLFKQISKALIRPSTTLNTSCGVNEIRVTDSDTFFFLRRVSSDWPIHPPSRYWLISIMASSFRPSIPIEQKTKILHQLCQARSQNVWRCKFYGKFGFVNKLYLDSSEIMSLIKAKSFRLCITNFFSFVSGLRVCFDVRTEKHSIFLYSRPFNFLFRFWVWLQIISI